MSQIKDDLKFIVQFLFWGAILILLGFGLFYWLSDVAALLS